MFVTAGLLFINTRGYPSALVVRQLGDPCSNVDGARRTQFCSVCLDIANEVYVKCSKENVVLSSFYSSLSRRT